MRLKYFAGMLLAFLLVGCGQETSAPDEEVNSTRQKVEGNQLPERPEPVAKGQEPVEMELETLSEKDFLAKFRYRAKPVDYFIGTDFVDKIDPQLYHFQRVEVQVDTKVKTEIRMQFFGAWAIWKNVDGNWEMLTTMTNPNGTMMHFHTLNPKFESQGSFEIACRMTDGKAVTIRRGKFTNEDTYEYTVATREGQTLIDSVNGLMAVIPSGTYKQLSETRIK